MGLRVEGEAEAGGRLFFFWCMVILSTKVWGYRVILGDTQNTACTPFDSKWEVYIPAHAMMM
jgi:hypothetical protein